jgi:hypothetical protein
MKRIPQLASIFTLVLALTFLAMPNLSDAGEYDGGEASYTEFQRGRSSGRSSGGFGRSSSSSQRRSSGGFGKSSSASKSNPKATTAKKSGSGVSTSRNANKAKPLSKRQQSKADLAVHQRAKANGTSFKSKTEATSAFKTKYADKYPAKYPTKPTTRPAHIPQTYQGPQGNTYNVTYNQAGGGYGYMNALGTFMLYDMMTDNIMMNQQMRSMNYAYGPTPVVVGRSPIAFFMSVLIGICFLAVIVVIVINVSKSRS